MAEVWKQVKYPNYGRYEVSNHGRIRSTTITIVNKRDYRQTLNGKVLSPRTNKIHPHLFVELYGFDDNGLSVRKTVYNHKATMEHFGPPPKKNEVYVAHIVSDYKINHVANLKWITHSQLVKKQLANGTRIPNMTLYKSSPIYQKSQLKN